MRKPGEISHAALPPRRIQSAYNQDHMKRVRQQVAARGDKMADAQVIASIER